KPTVAGQTFLSVSPTSGSVSASSPATITVTVNPAGLTPGDYYGLVTVSAANSTGLGQLYDVVLNVAPSGTNIGAFVQPTGLIFVGSVGGTNPTAKSVTINNPSTLPLTFTAISL